MKKSEKIFYSSFVIAVLTGFASYMIKAPLISILISVGLFIAMTYAFKYFWKMDKDITWFFKNGFFVFISTWYVLYTLLVNIG